MLLLDRIHYFIRWSHYKDVMSSVAFGGTSKTLSFTLQIQIIKSTEMTSAYWWTALAGATASDQPSNQQYTKKHQIKSHQTSKRLLPKSQRISPWQTQLVVQLTIKEKAVNFIQQQLLVLFYLCRCERKVLSLSLLFPFSDALACGNVHARVYSHYASVNTCICGWASEYKALEFPR